MKTLEILEALPGDIDWMVFFRLAPLRECARDDTIKNMFFLPGETQLDAYSHVVLSSEGRQLASKSINKLVRSDRPNDTVDRGAGVSLARRHASYFSQLPLEQADCIGFGRKEGRAPAFLCVEMENDVGNAKALFVQEPDREHYDLLRIVGIEFAGGEQGDGCYIARYRNRLDAHIRSALLARFTRTAHCNDFFLNHGVIDTELLAGLVAAFETRRQQLMRTTKSTAQNLASAAMERTCAMTCYPPAPKPPFPYGDLVPLGILLRGMKTLRGAIKDTDILSGLSDGITITDTQNRLLESRRTGLWSFHAGRLQTATDSALILFGVQDQESLEAIEAFNDGVGGYFPQLWSEQAHPGRMRADPANRHWRQVDYATTCLVRGLRAEMDLSTLTPLAFLEEGFDTRSGLFFANPYLVDWCLALAIKNDVEASQIRERLLCEILASANLDGSFGRYDRTLSTALAILIFDKLSCRGDALRRAQIYLMEKLNSSVWPSCTPFYSTFLIDKASSGAGHWSAQHIECQGQIHELSLYRDTYRMIFTSFAALALAVPGDHRASISNPQPSGEAKPRYCCHSVEQYIATCALPPYVRRISGAETASSNTPSRAETLQ